MAWTDPDSFVTRLFSGDPIAILISFLVTITLPALLHWYFYTNASREAFTPTFLLLGPTGSGKTSLVTLVPSTTSLFLPASIPLGSNKYRSENDYETQDASKHATKYLVVDTPGHGKLRLEQALSQLSNPAIKGVIFMVDSAALESSDSDTGRDNAQYLHDTLLAMQRRKLGSKSTAANKTDVPVLIAANKQDLFTALPAGAIRDRLQSEIDKVRRSKSRGISRVDSDPDADDEDDVLGGGGEGPFSFSLMRDEFDILIEVVGGAVRGEEAAKGVRKWEEWIGACL